MLRRHAVTLEYIEEQDIYTLDVDGYTITLTKSDLNNMSDSISKGGIEGAEEVARYLKQQDPRLYNTKFLPFADNPNAYDVLEVLQCQMAKPVYTQRPER